MSEVLQREAIVGCILGTAVGDAMGLPYEGIAPDRASRLLGPPDRYRFCFGRGMISDDTEHTCMVAQSLIEAGGDVDLFVERFATRLKWWILALPAGVGMATARSAIKLWLGVKPTSAGVFSAGNGPAMRAAIFGVAIPDVSQMLEMIRASTRMTHTDPKAEFGAIAVALAARHSGAHVAIDSNRWFEQVRDTLGNEATELIALLRRAIESVKAGESTRRFADALGLTRGVTGYIDHTVPVAIHAWLSHPNDFRGAVTSIIECGGDADTTAAIVGGIVGSGVRRDGIPIAWIEGIAEYPRSIAWMQKVAETLATVDFAKAPQQCGAVSRFTTKAPTVKPIAVLLRNLLFLQIVLYHGFRRLAPPY
ncbi:ADP-ribosyl-[dinitrogen reductase] glycohydrolase [Rosistilla ulvae]|uniref:ADP-ribosyl-[dinitrogen reductase] glycohydrolase n=1 Tax=Rosistilla ulvae TaxID=1930277 RepID=A0A517M2I6_9BACT|nr:ADP-ribosyl-[dinitrogen reductase] glycohydrolase [Rosistilla ulvae]